MSVEIRVPVLGESVTSATITRWLKQPGQAVAADEPVVELETDKISVEVPAPQAGILGNELVAVGAEVAVGSVLGTLDPNGTARTEAEPAKLIHPKYLQLLQRRHSRLRRRASPCLQPRV